jgi:hypothetical protein
MKKHNGLSIFSSRQLILAVAAMLLAAPLLKPDLAIAGKALPDKKQAGTEVYGFACGFDPDGSEEEIYHHRLNALRPLGRGLNIRDLSTANGTFARPFVEVVDDVALIEDDGALIVPPSKFDLNNKSLLFTPEADGYRVDRGRADFDNDFGVRLTFFLGPDNQLGGANNGYRDILLHAAPFPFFGTRYDTLYIGTNGYITFIEGDTNSRVSAAAHVAELPRIAPLWADLDATRNGDIYYNRLEGRHLITWNKVGQTQASGKSTFQAVLYDDGRIAFHYKKVKARSSLVGISPGGAASEGSPLDWSELSTGSIAGPVYELFSKERRLDLPAVLRTFYAAHPDLFDVAYVWTDFAFDNGLGVANAFNVRNSIKGIGIRLFDRGAVYGSPARLSTIIAMGDHSKWPSDPQERTAGLNSAISIACHELGHRWLSYVLFDAEHDIKDDLLGRDRSHWSFLVDTRTNSEGSFSSLMEGNSWRETSPGNFTTVQNSVNHFSDLDQYLMGLRPAAEVGSISYLVTDEDLKQILRSKSPVNGFSITATRKTTSVAQIVEREGARVPDASEAQKDFRVAFIMLSEQGARPSRATIEKIARYRDELVRYFSTATNRRGSLDGSLGDEPLSR